MTSPLTHRSRRAAALACALVAAALALPGCHAYERVEPADPIDPADSIQSAAALLVEAQPATLAAVYAPAGQVFTANELAGTRVYTPYYSVLVPFGLWPEGYAYDYSDEVDGVGLGHTLVLTHPANGDAAVIVYCYDAASLGFVSPQGEYAVLDLGISQADPSVGVALACGYAKQGHDAAQAELAAFAPNVAGVYLY